MSVNIKLGDTYEGEADDSAFPSGEPTEQEQEQEEENEDGDDPDPLKITSDDPAGPDSGNPSNEEDPDKVTDDEPEDEPVFDLENEQVQAALAAHFQVESFEEVEQILEDYENVVAELEELKAKAPATAEPTFQNEFQRRAYEHALRFQSAEDLASGFNSYIRLTSLDVPALEGKDALREIFRLENPEIPAEAIDEVFEEDYFNKYEANASLRTKYVLDKDIKEAKAKLATEQEKAKAPVAAEPQKPQQEEIPVTVQQSIAQRTAEFEASLTGLTSLTFTLDADGEENSFNFEVSEDQLELVRNTMLPYLQNPASYDKDGKLRSEFHAIESRNQLLVSMNHDSIVEQAVRHGINLGKEAQIKEVAGQKPNRQPQTMETKKVPNTKEDQKAAAIMNWNPGG